MGLYKENRCNEDMRDFYIAMCYSINGIWNSTATCKNKKEALIYAKNGTDKWPAGMKYGIRQYDSPIITNIIEIVDEAKETLIIKNIKLSISIDNLELPTRAVGRLKHCGIYTVNDLIKLRRNTLINTPGLGMLTVSEIIATIEDMGLKFKNRQL